MWQPIPEIEFFNLRNSIFNPIIVGLAHVIFLQFVMTVPFFLKTDLLGWKRMFAVMKQDEYEFTSETKIEVPFIYRGCRHPMQSGIMGLILFSSTKYDLGRVILASVLIIGQILGVRQEEKYLSQFEDYRKYKELVKNKFIPNLSGLFSAKLKKALNGDDKKE
jgi:protein-S-isoprenylcysteine O-methyltransferase Ste14